MPFKFIGSSGTTATQTGNNKTLTATYGAGETVFVVALNWDGEPSNPNWVCTDNGGNTYELVARFDSSTTPASNEGACYVWRVTNALAGTVTITVAKSGGGYTAPAVNYYRYIGLAPGPIQAFAGRAGGANGASGTDNVQGNPVTPTNQPALFFAATIPQDDGVQPYAGTGFTDRGQINAASPTYGRVIDKRLTSTATVTPLFTGDMWATHQTIALVVSEVENLVQAKTFGASVGTNSFTLNANSNFSSGNTVIVKASLYSPGSSSLTASCLIGGIAATLAQATDVDGDNQRQLYIWHRVVENGSSAVQITLATGATNGSYEVSVEEWLGKWTPEVGGTFKTSGTGSTTPAVSTSSATLGANRVLAALVASQVNTATVITTPTGFSERLENEAGSNSLVTSHVWDESNAAGIQTATWTFSVARRYGAAIQAYAPSSSNALDWGGGTRTNGTPRYYTLTTPALGTGDWCIGVWCRPPTSVESGVLVSVGNSTSGNGFYLVTGNSDGIGFSTWTTTSSSELFQTAGYPSTPNGFKEYLVVMQSRSGTRQGFIVQKGGTATVLTTAAITGIINSGTGKIGDWSGGGGFSARFPIGEIFFLTNDSLSTSEITTLAAGESIATVRSNRLVHLPFRSGEVSTETNLGTGDATYNATRVSTGFTSTVEFFPYAVLFVGAATVIFNVSSAESINNQILSPSSVVSAGSWLSNPSGTLQSCVNELVPSTAEFIETFTDGDVVNLAVPSAVEPLAGQKNRVKYMIKGSSGNGCTVELLSNTTVIATWTHNPAPTDWTTYSQLLTAPQLASISDFNNLRIRITEV
jgi:hypothetical protein